MNSNLNYSSFPYSLQNDNKRYGLDDMPEEVLDLIVNSCDRNTLISLVSVSKKFHKYLDNPPEGILKECLELEVRKYDEISEFASQIPTANGSIQELKRLIIRFKKINSIFKNDFSNRVKSKDYRNLMFARSGLIFLSLTLLFSIAFLLCFTFSLDYKETLKRSNTAYSLRGHFLLSYTWPAIFATISLAFLYLAHVSARQSLSLADFPALLLTPFPVLVALRTDGAFGGSYFTVLVPAGLLALVLVCVFFGRMCVLTGVEWKTKVFVRVVFSLAVIVIMGVLAVQIVLFSQKMNGDFTHTWIIVFFPGLFFFAIAGSVMGRMASNNIFLLFGIVRDLPKLVIRWFVGIAVPVCSIGSILVVCFMLDREKKYGCYSEYELCESWVSPITHNNSSRPECAGEVGGEELCGGFQTSYALPVFLQLPAVVAVLFVEWCEIRRTVKARLSEFDTAFVAGLRTARAVWEAAHRDA